MHLHGMLRFTVHRGTPRQKESECQGGPFDGETRPPYYNGHLEGRSTDHWLFQGSADPSVQALREQHGGDYHQAFDHESWVMVWRWVPDGTA